MTLTHIVRTLDVVDFSMPFVLIKDACYTEDAGSLEEDLSRRSSYNHPSLKE